ncbi:MAG: glycosidase, partial [Bradyrhizobium sp.]
MPGISVRFRYVAGIAQDAFSNVRLVGSWDALGRHANNWTTTPMVRETDLTGCPSFTASIQFDSSQQGQLFRWGVELDGPSGQNIWGIATEVADANSSDRTRAFTLGAGAAQEEVYYLTHCSRLGAQKIYPVAGGPPALRFSVWAPNARQVEIVFALGDSGYIDDSGGGIDAGAPVIPLRRCDEGIWESDLTVSPELASFDAFAGKLYMFRITRKDSSTAYRTDLHSRRQIGTGSFDPAGAVFSGDPSQLDAAVSCSIVTDVDQVTVARDPRLGAAAGFDRIAARQFWQDERAQA